jgi:hypothetical protein
MENRFIGGVGGLLAYDQKFLTEYDSILKHHDGMKPWAGANQLHGHLIRVCKYLHHFKFAHTVIQHNGNRIATR